MPVAKTITHVRIAITVLIQQTSNARLIIERQGEYILKARYISNKLLYLYLSDIQ